MKHQTFKLLSLALLIVSEGQAYSFSKSTPRAHSLWDVECDESTPLPLRNVSFQRGELRLGSVQLSTMERKSVRRFYKQCMSDGGMYCDSASGSCEQGTCGKANSKCKPRMSGRERNVPQYGRQCVEYALTKVLRKRS